jgi:hypothetical protein
MGPIVTSNPVNMSYPLNAGRLVWLKVVPWLAGGPTWTDLMRPGPAALASSNVRIDPDRVTFLGTPGAVQVPGPIGFSGDSPRAFALTVWPGGGTSRQEMISGGLGLGNRMSNLILNLPEAGGVYFSGYSNDLNTTTTIRPSGPTRIMFSYAGGGISGATTAIYFDGLPQPLAFGGGNTTLATADQNWAVGFNQPQGGFYFAGSVDDVTFWGRPIDGAEALADFAESSAGYPNALNRYRYV